MRTTRVVVCLVSCLVTAAVSHGQGLAHNENFIVLTSDSRLAEDVLQSANKFREQLSTDWLGKPLPPGAGRTIIHVELATDDRDQGLMWPIDSAERQHHKLWLVTDHAGATGSTLRHEILHTVFATAFPDGLPAWIDEGAASQCDDAARQGIRRRIMDAYVRFGNWPDLWQTLNAPSISKGNRAAYSVAASVTAFLLTRGNRATLLRFAITGRQNGWDRALQQHYDLRGVEQLQQVWQQWTIQSRHVASASFTGPLSGTQRR